MDKREAIHLLGGSTSAAAAAIGISAPAVAQWPENLPPRIADRVQAALWRKQQQEGRPELVNASGAPAVTTNETQGQCPQQQETRDAA